MDDNSTPTPPELSQTWKGIAFAILVGLSFAGGRFSVKPSGPQNRDPLQDEIRGKVQERVGPAPRTHESKPEESLKRAMEALERTKRDLETQWNLPPGELDERAKEREESIPESK